MQGSTWQPLYPEEKVRRQSCGVAARLPIATIDGDMINLENEIADRQTHTLDSADRAAFSAPMPNVRVQQPEFLKKGSQLRTGTRAFERAAWR